jgi:hypothetical protein
MDFEFERIACEALNSHTVNYSIPFLVVAYMLVLNNPNSLNYELFPSLNHLVKIRLSLVHDGGKGSSVCPPDSAIRTSVQLFEYRETL